MNRIPLFALAIVACTGGDTVLTGTRSDGVTILCVQGESYYDCGPDGGTNKPTSNGGNATGVTTGSDDGSAGSGDTGSGDSGSGGGSTCEFGCDGSGSDTGSGGSDTGSGDGGSGGGSGSDCQPWPNGPATVLWPPNHKLHTYTLADCAGITMCPNGQPGALDGTISKITVDEAVDVGQGGDGHTTDYDVKIDDATHFELRSERQGGADGRVYTVYYTDASGNAGSCQFLVPHNKGPFEGAVDSGTVVTVMP